MLMTLSSLFRHVGLASDRPNRTSLCPRLRCSCFRGFSGSSEPSFDAEIKSETGIDYSIIPHLALRQAKSHYINM